MLPLRHPSPLLLPPVGWLKTVDQYALGANNSIQHTNTNLEYDTVMLSLSMNPDRRFIAVEQVRVFLLHVASLPACCTPLLAPICIVILMHFNSHESVTEGCGEPARA